MLARGPVLRWGQSQSSYTKQQRPHDATTSRQLAASHQSRLHVLCKAQGKDSPPADVSPAQADAKLKAVWYGAEQFGNFVAMTKGGKGEKQNSAPAAATGKMAREALLASIKEDYDVSYFISGQGSMAGYAPDCTFADPFVSFNGVDRFRRNVSNLGGLMSQVELDVYDWQEEGEDKVVTRWRFSCVLDLPWKPRLAAAGGTTHVIDVAQGRVVQHIERWEVEPARVVGQLLRPANKLPANQWEVLFMALSEGDAQGVWYASSANTVKLTAPLAGLVLLWHAAGGADLGAGEGLLWSGLGAGLFTEVYKFVRGMLGGESG